MTDKRDYIIIAEDLAKTRIVEVQLEKDNLLKQAKEKARKDLRSHDDDLQIKTQEKVTQLYMNNSHVEEIDSKTEAEIKDIEVKFKNNKQGACDFLFKSITDVVISIPDVVKADFEKSLK